MWITIDSKNRLKVDIGDKEPTPELIEKLRKKYNVDKAYIPQTDKMSLNLRGAYKTQKKAKSKKDIV